MLKNLVIVLFLAVAFVSCQKDEVNELKEQKTNVSLKKNYSSLVFFDEYPYMNDFGVGEMIFCYEQDEKTVYVYGNTQEVLDYLVEHFIITQEEANLLLDVCVSEKIRYIGRDRSKALNELERLNGLGKKVHLETWLGFYIIIER